MGRPVNAICFKSLTTADILLEDGELVEDVTVDATDRWPSILGCATISAAKRTTDNTSSLPEDDTLRNEYPMFDGLLAYFPNALAEAARVSKIGNDQHNPGEPMHWARGKSTDHANKIMRHLVDVGKKDARGVRHSARLVWRALALLQEELEREEGYPLSRASRAG